MLQEGQHKFKTMKGRYIKPNGQVVEILNFDEENKMVHVNKSEGGTEWVHDTEYNTWSSVDEKYPIYIPDMPAQMLGESELNSGEVTNENIQTSLTTTSDKPKRKRIKKSEE